jgi:biopolymer transport protein ExbD
MGKVKIKKSDIWIDMTPMSDVMTLLLTFFMLTSTFIKNEPVRVNTPGTVIETKVPEADVLTITINPEKGDDGKPTGEGMVFIGMSNAEDLINVLKYVQEPIANDKEMAYAFSSDAQFGVAFKDLKTYLKMSPEQRSKVLTGQDKTITKPGIPLRTDTLSKNESEFQQWVRGAQHLKDREDSNKRRKIALVIKADHDTPYKVVKQVMDELQEINETHYYLSTQLDGKKVSSASNYIIKSTGGK